MKLGDADDNCENLFRSDDKIYCGNESYGVSSFIEGRDLQFKPKIRMSYEVYA